MRDYQMWVATTIQAERAARGMTLKALSDQSGVALRVLIRALKGERDLNTEQLVGIANALGLRPSYLLSEAERRREMAPRVDMSVVAEVLAEETTLTPQQKDSLRKEAAGSDPLSGDSHGERPQRKVL